MLFMCCGYWNYNAQGAFVIIFFICSDIYNCLRSLCTAAIRTENAKEKRKFSLERAFVLKYFLYGHPRNFKFKQKYKQYGLCFQTIFPFLMTMLYSCKLVWKTKLFTTFHQLKMMYGTTRILLLLNFSSETTYKSRHVVYQKGRSQNREHFV